MKIKLKPFNTPNFVIQEAAPKPRQEGFHEPPKYHLREIPEEDLDDLCNEFRAEIFRKAGKKDPDNSRGSGADRVGSVGE